MSSPLTHRWLYVISRLLLIPSLIVFGAQLIFDFLVSLNLRLLPTVPWFAAVIVGVGLVLTHLSARWNSTPHRSNPPSRWKYYCTCGLLSVGLAFFALALMGKNPLLAEKYGLPGDLDHVNESFKVAESLALLFSTGLIEEVAVRGVAQLGLQRVFSAGLSEVMANLLFVLFHASRFREFGELTFVIVLRPI